VKKILLLLILSFISTQTIARVGEVYDCEFYSFVNIPIKASIYYDDYGISTNWLSEKNKKFTFLREENQIILNSQGDDLFNYVKIPVNLKHGYTTEVDEYFSGAKHSTDKSFRSFMINPSSFGSTTESTFYYTTYSHEYGDVFNTGTLQSGIAECTH